MFSPTSKFIILKLKKIRVIRVQKPYASRINMTLRVLRKIIRVIREIRVQQKTYASRLNNDSRVLRKIIRVIRVQPPTHHESIVTIRSH